MRLLFLIGCLVIVAVAAQANTLRQVTPDSYTNLTLTANVRYGDDPFQKYDVYAPKVVVNAPIIVFVHGGGWVIGDKGNERAVNSKMLHWTGKGAIFVSVNYRMIPKAYPYAQAQDIAQALADIQQRGRNWGGDLSKMVVMGHSAGAHLVMLVQSDPALMATIKPWAATIALDSAVYDVADIMNGPHLKLYDEAFQADPAYWQKTSPTAVLAGKIPPSLLVCSSKRLKSCPAAQAYAQKALSLGNDAQVEPENLTHEEINETLGARGFYTDAVDRFLRDQNVF